MESTRFIPSHLKLWVHKYKSEPVGIRCKNDFFGPTNDIICCRWIQGNLSECQSKSIIISCDKAQAATLNHHLNQTTKELKEIAEKLQESLYVDNCVASVDSEEELKYFCNESQKLLQSAKFDLRGWKHTKFKETVLNQEENEDEVEVPLLGLSWNTVDDTFIM
ncbi:reverse transcriptase [Caerostris extrusa]|uniref:Reverse transcriptase n=1 Tax=Caerostris extrusa TaxID=172846 RepID=A0AAV4R4Y2_CAEEX|nr:reverse transcriptase [Caerostris extrusa]